LNTDTEWEAQIEAWESIGEKGGSHVLLVSPERLARPEFRKRLRTLLRRKRMRLGRLVVDEVHCLSDWGHDSLPRWPASSSSR